MYTFRIINGRRFLECSLMNDAEPVVNVVYYPVAFADARIEDGTPARSHGRGVYSVTHPVHGTLYFNVDPKAQPVAELGYSMPIRKPRRARRGFRWVWEYGRWVEKRK